MTDDYNAYTDREERERQAEKDFIDSQPPELAGLAKHVWGQAHIAFEYHGGSRLTARLQEIAFSALTFRDCDDDAVASVLAAAGYGKYIDIAETVQLHYQQLDAEAKASIQGRYDSSFGDASAAGNLLGAHAGPPPAIWGHGLDVLWVNGESLLITSAPSVGKTTLAGLLARGQLFGGDVLGYPVQRLTDGQRILYLAIDRPDQISRAVARQFSPAQREEIDDQFIIRAGPLPADAAENNRIFVDLAEYYKADFIYLDSLKDAALGLTEDRVAASYSKTRNRLLATGRQLVELHHLAKSGADYGSVWLRAGTGSEFKMSGQASGTRGSLVHEKPPAHKIGPLKLIHDRDAGEISVAQESESELPDESEKSGLAQWIARQGQATLDETAKYLFGDSEIAAKRRAKRALDKLSGEAGPLSETTEPGKPSTWLPLGVTAHLRVTKNGNPT